MYCIMREERASNSAKDYLRADFTEHFTSKLNRKGWQEVHRVDDEEEDIRDNGRFMYKDREAESAYYLSKATSPLVAVAVEKATSGTVEEDEVTEEKQVPKSLVPVDIGSVIEFMF